MFRIKFITADSEEFVKVKEIRRRVFLQEQGADENQEFDRFDKIGAPAVFALLFEDEKIAGTARLAVSESGYKVGRIAILKEYRGKGYGDVIVRAMLNKAFDTGADKVLVDAQTCAVPFYEKIGFSVIGEEFTDRGLPHIPMSVKIENVKTKCSCK